MNFAATARIAKIVALVSFLLPWFTVSCAGHPLGTATGLDLSLGNITFHDPINGSMQIKSIGPSFFLVGAVAVIIMSLIPGKKSARNMRYMLASAIFAFVLIILGVQIARSAGKNLASSGGNAPLAHAADGTFTVETRIGYYIALLSLVTASGLCLIGLNNGRLVFSKFDIRKFPNSANHILRRVGEADADLEFWDAMHSRDDHDLLEEYLIRFPVGRFAQIAHNKLARARPGRTPPGEPAQTPAGGLDSATEPGPPASSSTDSAAARTPSGTAGACARCGAAWEADARFCSECGGERAEGGPNS